MNKRGWKYAAALSVLTIAGACGWGSDKSQGGVTVNASDAEMQKLLSEPVVIDVYIHTGGYTLERFMQYYGDAIQKKYPNFSFNMHTPEKGSSLQDKLAQGTNIDLIQVHRANTYELMYDTKLMTDISDLIKKYKYDLNKIEPVVLEEMRQLGNGKILGLPYESRTVALFYNKGIFDKFGVAYPKNNMTWDDALELAKKLSRIDGGVNYQGLIAYPRHVFLMNQMSQGYVDPASNKTTLNNDNWKKVFETLAAFHRIDNNPYIVPSKISNTFWVEGRAAMYASMFVPDANYIMNAEIDWDVAEYPEMRERRGVGSGMLNYYFNLTSVSKNRDQAFLAAAFLASEEYQKEQVLKGYISSLKGGSYQDSLGKGVPQFANRNLKVMKASSPAAAYPVNQYQGIADKNLDSAFDAIFAENKDINTVLREAEEKANKQIQEAIAAGN